MHVLNDVCACAGNHLEGVNSPPAPVLDGKKAPCTVEKVEIPDPPKPAAPEVEEVIVAAPPSQLKVKCDTPLHEVATAMPQMKSQGSMPENLPAEME